jgi:hypothetical protein
LSEATEFREAEEAAFDSLPLREGCLFCEWSYLGTAAEGREEALQHRLEAHPDLNPKRYKRQKNRNLHRYRQPALHPEEVAEIAAEHKRRAQLHGLNLY